MDTPSPIQENPATIQPATDLEQVSVPSQVQSSSGLKRFIPLIFGGLVLLLIVIVGALLLLPRNQGANVVKQVSLTWWGVSEPTQALKDVVAEFQTKNPGVTINYAPQSLKDYRERLQSAFVRGQGPDIFEFHNSWVPMLVQSNIFAPLPSSVISPSEYDRIFYPVARQNLKLSQGYIGVPLYTDGLALFVNRKILSASGKAAPTTWEEVSQLAKIMTIRDADGKIDRAGIALGTSANIDHFSDILTLLILQNGGNPAIPNDPDRYVADALSFYSQFYRVDKVWDETLPNSTFAFATEKVAMIFAPASRIYEVRQINPNVDFAVFPVPQLPNSEVNYASYWVEGVAQSAKDTNVAWQFLKFISETPQLEKLYAGDVQEKLLGRPYPRTDMASQMRDDLFLGAFVKQAPTAKSWYMASRTFDNGLNDQMTKVYSDAISALNTGRSTQEVIPTLTTGVNDAMMRFSITP